MLYLNGMLIPNQSIPNPEKNMVWEKYPERGNHGHMMWTL